MRVRLQPTYVLHSRPYRDSSLLVEVFTAEHGRVGLVARGARRKSRSGSSAALLQPFVPMLLGFTGRGELKTLTATETAGRAHVLVGERLYSGLYLNELLVRLLHRHDPHPELFAAYGSALERLAADTDVDHVLRQFELILIAELGYGFELNVDGQTGEAIRPDAWYRYVPEYGLVSQRREPERDHAAFRGSELQAIAAGDFTGQARHAAKRLTRQILAEQLGETPLRSRELFLSHRRKDPPGAAKPVQKQT
ncbi:MAG: DNA repair protein RecO [Pseudomonadota bacterium]